MLHIRWRYSRVLFACILGITTAHPLLAQTPDEIATAGDVAALRVEVAQLRQELESLRTEMRRRMPAEDAVARLASRYLGPALADTADDPHSTETDASAIAEIETPQDPPIADAQLSAQRVEDLLAVIQSQVEQHAQTKVESNSKLPVKLFGTIVSNTFVNSDEANWMDIPNLVTPAPERLPAGSFSSTLRQSRIGALVEGVQVGPLQASGFLAFDFFGGTPAFQTGQTLAIPRLLYGFVRLASATTTVEVGQDHMLLAPRNPTSLAAMAFPNLYRSGNLYLRVPQVRVEHRVGLGSQSAVTVAGAIQAPIAGDVATAPFTFVPPNLAGERSRRPAVQARVGWEASRATDDAPFLELGVSGHHGRERFADRARSSWAVAVDGAARTGPFGLSGEWFTGSNIDAFGGSLGQLARSTGGFLQASVGLTRRVELNAGGGVDRLMDLQDFQAPLEQNSSSFANVVYQFTPELASSFEYRWLSTRPAVGASRRNHHLNWAIAYTF